MSWCFFNVIRGDASNEEMQIKGEEVERATEARNCKIQESEVVNHAVDDFAGGLLGSDHLQHGVKKRYTKTSFH